MPGINRIAHELGCSARTVNSAILRMEAEGLILNKGRGRSSEIVIPKNFAPPALRLQIMPYEREDINSDFLVNLRYKLQQKGFVADFSEKTLCDLGMNPNRVARFVSKNKADAWIVDSGSKDVLEWFVSRDFPIFAICGRLASKPIASTGPRKSVAVLKAINRFAELGHQRIVMLSREERRKPTPGRPERLYLKELKKLGIPVGPFNFPDWDETPEGLFSCLSSLFKLTPPTAIIADGVGLYVAVQQFLLNHGLRVPQDVSIVCSDPHDAFAWSTPAVAHIDFDSKPWIRDIIQWVQGIAQGETTTRRNAYDSKFIEGGTIGPPPTP